MNAIKGFRVSTLILVCLTVSGCIGMLGTPLANSMQISSPIVDTGQDRCYDDRNQIPCPQPGEAFYGTDAQYNGNQPRYIDNGDGTITDLGTGLMWQQSVEEKRTYSQAAREADPFNLAGYSDWRLPTIKELYSLIDFRGIDVRPESRNGATPFIDTDYFDFKYGDTNAGERIIDAQWVSSTEYVGGNLVFGVNFADGRIKGYGLRLPGRGEKTFFVRHVRGSTGYGENIFVDNGDGTISDIATGLVWAQEDSGFGMDWEDALAYVQGLNDTNYLGYNDWRLPNAKELQSIVDYSRSPSTTNSAAINPLFKSTSIIDEAGNRNWAFYWTSTTHATERAGDRAVYIAFGEAFGYMNGRWIDVHGAGAQRSNAKSGDAIAPPFGSGPQGDAFRTDNFVRPVRSG